MARYVTNRYAVTDTYKSILVIAKDAKVKVVPSADSLHTAGTQIPTTGGSTNMSGTTVAASASVSCTIYGADLETASSGDGAKIIKVFGKDAAGNWSV